MQTVIYFNMTTYDSISGKMLNLKQMLSFIFYPILYLHQQHEKIMKSFVNIYLLMQ